MGGFNQSAHRMAAGGHKTPQPSMEQHGLLGSGGDRDGNREPAYLDRLPGRVRRDAGPTLIGLPAVLLAARIGVTVSSA